jgi:hypothetical protein
MDILGINNHMRFGFVHKWGIPLGLMAVLMGKGMPQLIFLKKMEGWAELDGFWTAGKSTIPRIFCPPSSRSKVVFWRHSLIFKASHISISV